MKKLLSVISMIMVMVLFSCGVENNENEVSEEQFCNGGSVLLKQGYIYRDNNDYPMYLDYKTMNSSTLCNTPNCIHASSSCISYYLKDIYQLPIIYNNCVYYFDNIKSFVDKNENRALELKMTLMKYDLEQMKISKVAEIDNHNANSDRYLIDSKCYFTTNYGNPKYDELGNVRSSSNGGGGNLFSIDLNNGEITDYGEIFDYEALKKEFPSADSSTDFEIKGKHGEILYLNVSYQKERPSREFLEQGIGEPPVSFGDTYTFNIKTNEITKLSNQRLISVINGYYTYFSGNDESTLFIQNLNTDETAKLVDYSGSRYAMVHNDKVWDNSICFDIKTGKKVTFSDLNDATVIAVYENNYIVMGYDREFNTIFEKIPCEEIDGLFE